MKNFFKIPSFLILAVMMTALVSCSTVSEETWIEEDFQQPEDRTAIQDKLVESAGHYIGTTSGTLKSDDRNYCLDCSGLMLAIYYRAGIDLEKCYVKYLGNGVKRLYSCLRDHKLIFNTKTPRAGDLIFWDNTWDRNEDRKFNDYFTHTGIVVDVDSEGTITYAHHNYRQGVVYEKMNLRDPNDTSLNSPMRMRGSPPAPEGQYLASHLVRVFGRAWQLPKKFMR